MGLTIFSRLIMGFCTVFLIMGGVNVYSVMELNRLNKETAKILNVDEHILDFRKRLADSILSQFGYEKKYVITRDDMFKDQFLSAKKDFIKYLAEAASVADTDAKRDSLGKIRLYFEKYQSLVDIEMETIKKRRPGQKGEYGQEEGRLVEQILKESKVLEAYAQQDIHMRMNVLRDGTASARKLAIVILSLGLVLAIGITFLSTRSITKPLLVLIDKTKEISKGVLEGDLKISSPPEISELAAAVNMMCDKLKRVDKMKSEFFSAMSHELRTPLTSIKEGISLLQEGVGGSTTDRQKRLLSILSEESNRLIGLVNSLLDLSKMEAGMMTYRFNREHFPPLIKKVILEVAPIIEAKRIRIKEEISEDLPPLRMDRERMLQALRNLIGNAVKFTPHDGQIRVLAFPRNGGVEFSVRDTGPGIPEENLSAIFEKFHQPPVKTSEWVKGTGLGLAFVKHIITAHGGKVWAESEVGQGSAFTFVLPP